jgi:hypothetical protein
MQTRSQSIRVSPVKANVESNIKQIEVFNATTTAANAAAEEKIFKDFETTILKSVIEVEKTIGKVNRVKVVKKMFEFIDKEILIVYPIVKRKTSPEGLKKFMLELYYRANNLSNQIERLSVTMSDHKILFDTHSLLRHVKRKIHPFIV